MWMAATLGGMGAVFYGLQQSMARLQVRILCSFCSGSLFSFVLAGLGTERRGRTEAKIPLIIVVYEVDISGFWFPSILHIFIHVAHTRVL